MVTAVLVVEDDQDLRQAIADVVSDCGRPVFTARDGEQALELLDEGNIPRPSLILLDWLMTPMDGRTFLEKVKGRDDFEQLAVVIMSGLVPIDIPPGVVGILQKPFEVDALLAVLGEHCPPSLLAGA